MLFYHDKITLFVRKIEFRFQIICHSGKCEHFNYKIDS